MNSTNFATSVWDVVLEADVRLSGGLLTSGIIVELLVLGEEDDKLDGAGGVTDGATEDAADGETDGAMEDVSGTDTEGATDGELGMEIFPGAAKGSFSAESSGLGAGEGGTGFAAIVFPMLLPLSPSILDGFVVVEDDKEEELSGEAAVFSWGNSTFRPLGQPCEEFVLAMGSVFRESETYTP